MSVNGKRISVKIKTQKRNIQASSPSLPTGNILVGTSKGHLAVFTAAPDLDRATLIREVTEGAIETLAVAKGAKDDVLVVVVDRVADNRRQISVFKKAKKKENRAEATTASGAPATGTATEAATAAEAATGAAATEAAVAAPQVS